MYTEPHNILGLAPPAFGQYHPLSVVDRAHRDFNDKFSPDQWRLNGFDSPQAAAAALQIGQAARNSFDAYYRNPYCENDTYSLRAFQAPHKALNLSHFADDCICSFGSLRFFQLCDAMLPPHIRTLVQTPKEPPGTLEEMCPCTSEMLLAFHKNAEKATVSTPPPLQRIYNVTPWISLSFSVLWWKFDTWSRGFALDWAQSEAGKNRWEREGWAGYVDWHPSYRVCEKEKSSKMDVEDILRRWRDGRE
jgi:hypothetical protein